MGNPYITVGGDLADDLGLDTNATLINGQSLLRYEIDG